jgi:hypothetical protein
MLIKKYQDFLINEKFDDNIKSELKRLGVKDEGEIRTHLKHAHSGNLAKYLQRNGKNITFGLLKAIFLDAQEAKKRTDVKIGIIKAVHRVLPMALAPFFPIIAIVGYILGTSRAFNKVIAPILADPGNDYPEFLNKLITNTMKVAEGEIVPIKDRFTRAFVVSDGIVDIIKPDILREFALHISNKMNEKNPDEMVPDNYIENELKKYLNRRYDIDPEIPLKESLLEKISISDYKNWAVHANEHFYKQMGEIFKNEKAADHSRNYDRIYYDLNVNKDNFEVEIPLEIKDFFRWYGRGNEMEIVDYHKGICKDKDGRIIKIGKLLRKLGEEKLLDTYNKSKTNTLKNVGDLQVVISRHPYDIIGMSTDRGWTTCHDLKDKRYGGEHLEMIKYYLQKGSLVAYLIRKEDRNIEKPISRILIVKEFRDLKPNETYGTYVKEFDVFVKNWCVKILHKYL